MGLSPNLPDHILNKIDASARQPLGKAGMTQAEVTEAASFSLEKELHSEFMGWLNRNGFSKRYFHADMRKRSTLWIGHPDFTIWRATRILFLEFKIKPNGLTPEQEWRFTELSSEGSIVLVCYNYPEAVKATKEFFNLP